MYFFIFQRDSLLRSDDLSPTSHLPHDDSSYKTKNSVNTGPGIVPHADLVRMFPTPPSLEPHPHSPSTTNMADHFYPANPPVPCVPTPPEFGGHSGMCYGDIVKTEKEERTDILAALKVKLRH